MRLTGARVVVLESSVPSTQDIAHQLAGTGAPSGTLVLADEQTAGRGRHGRPWHSPAGFGVWMSLVLRPIVTPASGALAIRAGLAAVEAIAAASPEIAPRLKWPNDIMVADRKAGGVLCEARWSGDVLGWIAVGVGINVFRAASDPSFRRSSIALSDASAGASRLGLLEALVPRLVELEKSPALLEPAEQKRFLASAWPAPGDDLAGIDPDGALLLRGHDGTITRRVDAD